MQRKPFMKNISSLIVLLFFAFHPAWVLGGNSDNGKMSTYGDSSFTGLNGVMDTYYIEETRKADDFNGIRTEIEPQHESLAKGLNGVMDVLEAESETPILKPQVPLIRLTFHYPVNEHSLNDDDKSELFKTLEILKNEAVQWIHLVGYADPTGTASYNLKLSERRAKFVKEWLVSHGIEGSKIKLLGAGIDFDQQDYQLARRVDLSIEL